MNANRPNLTLAGQLLKAASLAALLGAVTAGAAPQPGVDFKRDIQPILEARCHECHDARKQKSGLRLDQKAGAFREADSGKPAVVAGDPAASELLRRIAATNDDAMPPKGARLSGSQVALLRDWIAQGAKWPEETVAGRKHWAYVKPVRPPLPRVKDRRWPRNAIDYFVLARLDQEKMRPSSPADKAVLLRRASLDLTGLPPTLEELEAFLADKRADAYEQAVERLLASSAYGERWARPWLDLARYADTQGYEKDNRRTMWPYRDWVIQALNRGLPFDQFTLEQLAGDLLPGATQDQKVATGFHRNTMTNTEGGTDNEEFRHEAIVDRVNTTMAAWMATTMNCCQCHNHKYDPLTTREYYQFYGFFNQTADADYDDEKPTLKVPSAAQAGRLASLRAEASDLEKAFNTAAARTETAQAQARWEARTLQALTNWQTLDPAEFTSGGGAELTRTSSKSIQAGGMNPSNDTYTVTASAGPGRITGFRLEVLETGEAKALGRHANGGFVLKRFEITAKAGGADTAQPVTLVRAVADFSEKGFPVTNLLAGTGEGWAIAAYEAKNKVRRSAYFTPAAPVQFPEGGALTFTLRHSDKHPGANLMRFRLSTTSGDESAPPPALPDDVRGIVLAAASQREEKQRARLKDYFQSIAPELKTEREALAAKRKAVEDLDKAIPITSVMEELPSDKQRTTHLLSRGSFLNKGEKVSPGVPAVLHPLAAGQPPNRVALARWLTDTNNPLTARVLVNRFWEQYFGRGLVETVEDFGVQSEPPTHPGLLDWLAFELMHPASGQPWDLKQLHRLIATSATYRQASAVSPALLQRDPNNRLYARGPRVRLEAEMVRDQALTVSGLLSRKLGGPSVMPPQPESVWQVVYSGDKWETSPGEDKHRRGLYTFWRRTSPHPMLMSFDAPSREFCVVKRNRSNTPLQALNTLNDPAFIEAAQALARRIVERGGADAKTRVAYAFRACLARTPKPEEVARLVALHAQELAHYRQDPKAAEKMASSEAGKAPEGSDLAELAAWTVVANVLLNLDEMITKG